MEKKEVETFGELLSKLFLEEWNKRDMNKVTGHDKLQHLLKWSSFTQFLKIYAREDEEQLHLFSEDCKFHLKEAVSVVDYYINLMLQGKINIETLILMQSAVVHLAEIAERSNPSQRYNQMFIRRAIQIRCKEMRAFRNLAKLAATLSELCQYLNKVDKRSLEEILGKEAHIFMHSLTDLCIPAEVEKVDSMIGTYDPHPCAFGVSQKVLAILHELQKCSESNVFRKIWRKRCDEITHECASLDDVVLKVWQPASERWNAIGTQVKSGDITFVDFENTVGNVYQENYNAMADDLKKMHIEEEQIISCLKQLKNYRLLDRCTPGAKTIYDLAKAFNLQGDFTQIKIIAKNAEMNVSMRSFDESVLKTCDFLMDITMERRNCLDVFVICKPLVQWLRESMKESGLKELKVFVDLAYMTAGDEPTNIARVQCVHSAVTGFAPLIFELKETAGYTDLLKLCSKVWKEEEYNHELPQKLLDTNGYLERLQEIKKAHGSVEVTSLMQAKATNDSGTYSLGNTVWKRAGQDQRSDRSALPVHTDDATVQEIITKIHQIRASEEKLKEENQQLQEQLNKYALVIDEKNKEEETLNQKFEALQADALKQEEQTRRLQSLLANTSCELERMKAMHIDDASKMKEMETKLPQMQSSDEKLNEKNRQLQEKHPIQFVENFTQNEMENGQIKRSQSYEQLNNFRHVKTSKKRSKSCDGRIQITLRTSLKDIGDKGFANWTKCMLALKRLKEALETPAKETFDTFIKEFRQEELDIFLKCLDNNSVKHLKPNIKQMKKNNEKKKEKQPRKWATWSCAHESCKTILLKLLKTHSPDISEKWKIEIIPKKVKQSSLQSHNEQSAIFRKKDAWEIGRLFTYIEGHEREETYNSLKKLDISKTIKLMRSCKLFEFDGSAEMYDDIIDTRNELMHSADNLTTPDELNDTFDMLFDLLKAEKFTTFQDCRAKLEELQELQKEELVINVKRLEEEALSLKFAALKMDALNNVQETKRLQDMLENTYRELKKIEAERLAEKNRIEDEIRRLKDDQNRQGKGTVEITTKTSPQTLTEITETTARIKTKQDDMHSNTAAKLQEMQTELDDLGQIYDDLGRRYEQLQGKTTNSDTKMQTRLLEKQQSYDSLHGEYQRLREKAADSDTKRQQIQTQLLQQRQSFDRLHEEYQQLREKASNSDTKMQQMQTQLLQQQQSYDSLNEEFQQLREKISVERAANSDTKSQQIQTQLLQQQQSFDSLHGEYLQLREKHAQPDPIEIQRQQENRRRAIARKRAKEQLRPRSPEPVEGRKHIDVQTELYSEELNDRVEEAKTGKDIFTQILEGDERRMRQQREVLRKEKETAEKIAARAFAQSYLADLVPNVFGTLSDNGYFYDPVERDIEQGFLPWLMDRVTERLEKSELGRIVLDGLLREVANKRREVYERLEQASQPVCAQEKKEEKNPTPAIPHVTIDASPPQSAPATTMEIITMLTNDLHWPNFGHEQPHQE